MKILITGGSGLLGQYLNIELSGHADILTIYNSHPGNCLSFNNSRLDLSNFTEFKNLFKSFSPDIVIHTASISRTDLADKLPKEYVKVINVESTSILAQLCSKHRAKLIYTSTDLVYDGLQGSMLKETSQLNPVSFYAETKLEGEIKIRETFENYIILRTALLFGYGLNHSENHFRSMYINLKAGRESKLFYDQFRTPLSIKNAARIISDLTKKDIAGEIINFGGKERLSRFELAEILCEEAGFDKSLLIKISMDEVPNLPRVPDVSMNTSKLNALGIYQASVSNSIREILSEETKSDKTSHI